MATPLIIDCDPGVDDAIALLLAFASPELDILGVTTVAGNVDATLTARNARLIRQIARREDVPVHAGSERPLVREPVEAGHFHGESAEFWLVFAGQIRYAFEGQQPFVASEGDVVYVPAGTWHATRYTGAEPACRLSITEYVGNALLLEPRP